MINLGLNPASLLGIALAVAGAGLYFLRTIRPELSRDHDIFFAAVGLLTGLILLSQGWRLDPILQFGQFLLAGSAGFFAFESIRMRGVTAEQAKRNTPIIDEDRPASRNYEYQAYEYQTAELYDELNPADERPVRPRIRGARDARNSRADDYRVDSYGESEGRERRRTATRSSGRDRGSERMVDERAAGERAPGESDRPRKRRPRTLEDRLSSQVEDRDAASETSARSARSERKSTRSTDRDRSESRDITDVASKPRRSRPASNSTRSRSGIDRPATADYADYEPIEGDQED
ncbi:hypothetical protein BST81_24615 [Leptolyngbya sp. 'hensonii']|uniref:Ycf66 family protein n=1 Tax=Leptolyngbya sp. 'hensonii' TaxID=1922337 RepID=UPI00094F7C6C|nr:Ycf66 family protein [Leptolyngbya sp. 'hensonii']OLP15709.1 hypothetical protein BST81_24615 [Leptolyngbya sp. 'hensonii']